MKKFISDLTWIVMCAFVLTCILFGCDTRKVGTDTLEITPDLADIERIYTYYNDYLKRLDKEYYNPATTADRRGEITREQDRIINVLTNSVTIVISQLLQNRSVVNINLPAPEVPVPSTGAIAPSQASSLAVPQATTRPGIVSVGEASK